MSTGNSPKRLFPSARVMARENPVNRFDNGRPDETRLAFNSSDDLRIRRPTGSHQAARNAESRSGADIVRRISDDERIRNRDPQIGDGLFVQKRIGLLASTGLGVPMRADVGTVNGGPTAANEFAKLAKPIDKLRGAKQALGDAALYCDDGTDKPGGRQAGNRFDGARNGVEVGETFLFQREDECPVEVQKDRFAIHRIHLAAGRVILRS